MRGGISFTTAITIILVVLQLLGVTHLPWWSWNPFELSAFIVIVWELYLLVPIAIIGIAIARR
jgi:hypothetical protein